MIDSAEIKKLIIGKLGIENLSVTEQNRLIDRLDTQVRRRINVALIKRLSQDDRVFLANLSSEEAIDRFVKEKIPDWENVARQVASDTIELFQQLRQAN